MTPGRFLDALTRLTFIVLSCAAGSATRAQAAPVPAASGSAPATLAQAMDWRDTPVDLSFLNEAEKPAGRRGFVRAQGDALVFADGSPARFWGTNLTAAALFQSDPQSVREQARRLSRLGFNLVRLHHHDSYWVRPNIFGPANPPDTAEPLPAMQDRIDWWIKCLKDEGLYVWLDLHVQRALRRGDGITAFDEIAKGKPGAQFAGFNYVNPDIQRAMKRFNAAYLSRVNRHTGLAYKDDPAVVAVLITNENDLTHHYGNALLPDKQVPWHTARYLAEARDFAREHGLPFRATWRAWEPGPATLFLNDLEHRFNADMITHLRGIGVKVPIATTSLWGGRLASLPALTTGDIIDVHGYDDARALDVDPRRRANAVHRIASAQVAGMPLTVSEWNMVDFPAPDRQALPLYMAASAVHQGWDALMQYAYAQTPLQRDGPPSNWHAFNDPSLLAMLPAAALLFRRQHVREATLTHALQPTPQQLFDGPLLAGGTAALRTAAERGRVVTVLPAVPELDWQRPMAAPDGARPLGDLSHPLVDADATAVASATGELRRGWPQGVFTIDTAQTQAAMGWLGGRAVALRDVDIAWSNPQAAVAVQSLDGKPVAESRDLLVSLGTPSRPQAEKQLPYRVEPARGVLEIRAPADLVLQALSASPGPVAAPRHSVRGGRHRVRLDGLAPVQWLRLRAPAAAR